MDTQFYITEEQMRAPWLLAEYLSKHGIHIIAGAWQHPSNSEGKKLHLCIKELAKIGYSRCYQLIADAIESSHEIAGLNTNQIYLYKPQSPFAKALSQYRKPFSDRTTVTAFGVSFDDVELPPTVILWTYLDQDDDSTVQQSA